VIDRVHRRVFVNAANVTASGPTVLVADLLPALYAAAPDAEFVTLIPDSPALAAAAAAPNARVIARPARRGWRNDLSRLVDLHGGIARLVRGARSDVCLTLGDVGPAGLPCPHVVFLHNPLFVYPPRDLAGHDDWSPAKRRYLLWQFRRSLAAVRGVIVQTPVMRARLLASFDISPDLVHVVPQPVPRSVLEEASSPAPQALAECRKPVKLLFLAAYYPHKNHRILPAVVREISARGLAASVQIFVTLGERAPAQLRGELRACSDVVTDLGPLPHSSVAGALRDATALFLPTLVETYGLIYLEAMACGRPILTSDRDFARWVCGDAARYFEPLSPASIVDAIVGLRDGPDRDAEQRALARLREFPADWTDAGARFARVLMLRSPPAAVAGRMPPT
jgi:glycosyltransferase involved in cell wall biosynthesis